MYIASHVWTEVSEGYVIDSVTGGDVESCGHRVALERYGAAAEYVKVFVDDVLQAEPVESSLYGIGSEKADVITVDSNL